MTFSTNEKTKEVSQRETSTSIKKVTCFGFGRRGHVKSDCPALQKKIKVNDKKDGKSKREYVAWKGNEVSSSSNEEQTNMTLMTSHHSDN